MSCVNLSDERCKEVASPFAGAAESISVSGVFAASGLDPLRVKAAVASAETRIRALGAFRWVVLVGTIVLGLHSVAHGLASSEQTVAQNGSPRAASAHKFEHSAPGGDLRPGSHSAHRWHKRSHKFPKSMMANDPSDDGTSSDPGDDDDDASDDLNCDDDTDGPIVTCISGHALYFIAAQTRSTPSSSRACSALFLTLQRLRC
jgi:hypothetical protein